MDRITLQINNQAVSDFESYRVECNLFVADDAFELVLADRSIRAAAGDRVKLYVNDQLELTGLVDARTVQYAKDGTTLTLAGRDLMGLLTDSYVENFPTKQDIKLSELARWLLADVPYIRRSGIIFGRGDMSRAVPLSDTEEDYDYQQLDPGKTIFETLKEYGMARGWMFFSLPDGTFVFGQPVTAGKALFSLINRRNDPRSNILEAELTEDISKRYSKITVLAQRQGEDDFALEDINATGSVTDPEYPFYKPFVAEALYDGQDLEKYARVLMDNYRFEGFSLTVKLPGHSQNGRNYAVNAIAHVEDDMLNIHGDYLIYDRVFEMDKQHGSTTTLKLSMLGILPA